MYMHDKCPFCNVFHDSAMHFQYKHHVTATKLMRLYLGNKYSWHCHVSAWQHHAHKNWACHCHEITLHGNAMSWHCYIISYHCHGSLMMFLQIFVNLTNMMLGLKMHGNVMKKVAKDILSCIYIFFTVKSAFKRPRKSP